MAAGQLVQLVEPAAEVFPAAQLEQLVAPVAVEYEPLGQLIQLTELDTEYLPTVQATQEGPVPALPAKQVDLPVDRLAGGDIVSSTGDDESEGL